eukprot:COSAG02_NODE_12728_length_1503_cov_0.927350_2_plen_157_part_00
MQANQLLAKLGRPKRSEQQHPGTKNGIDVIQIQSVVPGCAGQTAAQSTAQRSTLCRSSVEVYLCSRINTRRSTGRNPESTKAKHKIAHTATKRMDASGSMQTNHPVKETLPNPRYCSLTNPAIMMFAGVPVRVAMPPTEQPYATPRSTPCTVHNAF